MALTRPRAYQIYDIDYKQATRVVTTTNITLAGGAPNTVDSISLAVNDRVLVTGQTAGAQNGIYIVATLGTGSNGTWTRSTDTNATGELLAGTIVMVTEGAVYQDTQWKLITDDPITIGVTALTFVQNYSANSISSGTSNVSVINNGNVNISSGGTPNVFTVSSTGTVTTGNASVTGNITGNFFFGNGSQLTGIAATSSYGNANVAAYGEEGWAGNIIPSANAVYSLGNITNQWKSLYLSNSTLYIANVAINMGAGNVLQVAGSNVVTATASGAISTAGNITGGNILTSGLVSATGQITGSQFNGSGAGLTSIPGGNVTGTVASATAATAATTAGTVTTNAQPNITSVGTLSSLSVTGNINGANVNSSAWVTTKDVSATGNAYVNGFISVTGNLYVANVISQGNLSVEDPLLYLTANTPYPYNYDIGFFSQFQTSPGTPTQANGYQHTGLVKDQTDGVWKLFSNVLPEPTVTIDFTNAAYDTLLAGAVSATGNVTGNYFIGNGSQLTGIASTSSYGDANVSSFLANFGSNTISTSGNVTSGNILTTGLVSATGQITGSQFNGSGAGLTSIPGGNVTGTVPSATTAGTVTTAAQPNITSVGTLSSLSVTGNITSSANVAGGNVLATTTVSAASYVGSTVSVTANVTAGNILTVGLISATGNITSAGNISATYFIGNGSQLTGIVGSGGIAFTSQANTPPATPNNGDFWYNTFTDVKYQYINDGDSSQWVDQSFPTSFVTLATGTLAASGNITTGNLLTGGLISATGNVTGGNLISAGNIVTTAANATANIGSATTYFNTVHAKATSAQYADVAEKYIADQSYAPGTVVCFGGSHEVTISDQSHATTVAGVVSTNPAYIMNAGAVGNAVVEVALLGRVPCMVIGPVVKGDRLVSSKILGVAQALQPNLYQPGCIIGKALENYSSSDVGTIEVVVGRI